jgi:type I restriction enzyme, R subunit
MPTDMSERGLETLIETSLINQAGYLKGKPSDYDRAHCLDTTQLFAFLQATQPQTLDRLTTAYGDTMPDRLCKRISDQIKTRGIIDVLRNGIKAQEVNLNLYYKQPASQLNPETIDLYTANRFSITRQLRYSNDHKQLALDAALFINGIPILTFELKNNLTKQTVTDAMRQYQNDRDPREPLFQFGRCIVHFAIDEELVYMTTELKGKQTRFLPFNQGKKSEPDLRFPDSAGNPFNPNGITANYLWQDILTKPSLSNIIEKYAQIVEETGDDRIKRRKLVFPRYHQLDVVRQLLADAKANGVGQRYLIQHSTGSGKSNSITWLSHQLVELTNASNTDPVFDSVIVVTDRVILDKQIRDNIKQFAQVKGVVQTITQGSKQLRQALEAGKKLITTTVDKFSYVFRDLKALSHKRFAIIIDEAHSSQSGAKAAKMSAALSSTQPEADETIEDKILRIIEEQKLSSNASYYAFTATPKNKTIEVFGVPGEPSPDGKRKFYPYHVYSMKQAIEEGFILDVLKNYTTYDSYYKLSKKIEDDPEFDAKRAKAKLKQYVEGHPHAIRQKSEIMVDHFMQEVIRQRKIDGQAKAMVVTSSIQNAIQYKLAFDTYLREIKSPYKTIVAFSGRKQVAGKLEDEASMNGFPSNEIPSRLKQSEYRFLIVADKYQTGFDEPLLHTLYVDKPLSDIKAVQTLSRLNRAYPGKTDTFVLDFVNSATTIRQAFEPYYKTSILSEETDLDRLNDLQDALDTYQVYAPQEITEFIRLFLEDFGRDQLDPILNECVQTYKNDLDENQKVDFKIKAKSFIRNYQFLVQVRTFRNPYWESLRTFLKFLLPKLPLLNEGDLSYGVLESVDMDSYRVAKQTTQAILLEDSQELSPTPPEPAGRKYQPNIDFLSNIIQEFNQRFGNFDFTDLDRVLRLYFEDVPKKILEDEEYQNAKKHSDRQNTYLTFQKKYVDNFQDVIYDDEEAYRQFSDDQQLREFVMKRAFELDYDQALLQSDPNERRADDRNNPAIVWRGSKAGDLLKFARTWVGNDLEECLQAVYENRSEAEF